MLLLQRGQHIYIYIYIYILYKIEFYYNIIKVYMRVIPLGDLNPDPYPSHPTSTYTCGMTIATRVCGGQHILFGPPNDKFLVLPFLGF